MVFWFDAPATQVAVIRMAHQNYSRNKIRTALGECFSNQSFRRWNYIYNLTQRVIQDPSRYKQQGAQAWLTPEDRLFMLELIRTEPGLFLDELRCFLYDESGTLLSISTIHKNLVDKMEITLKKANTVNIRKSLRLKFAWVDEMAQVPAEFLVFTGWSSF
jgi:transposase